MPESLRTGQSMTTKPLWQVYYPDRDPLGKSLLISRENPSSMFSMTYLVKAKLAQHDTNNQNGTISKEKATDDIEVIMLGKQVICHRKIRFLFSNRVFDI